MNENIIERTVLDELVRGILNAVPRGVSSIILYGSAARGTAQPDSDIDIAVIVSRSLTDGENDQLDGHIADMNLKYNKVFSVIDLKIDDYRKWLDAVPFYRNVETEGIVLWKTA